MYKKELIAAIAEKAGISKKDADKALAATIDTIVDTMKKGDKVQLVGFGGFEVRERAARTGRNPQKRRSRPAPMRRSDFKITQESNHA